MNKKQMLSLLIGLFFLAGGIFFLARMTQVENPNSLAELFDFSGNEADMQVETSANVTVSGTIEAEGQAEEEETSGLTRLIEWLTGRGIPVWVYLVVFLAVILFVRGYGIYREVRAYRKNNKK